MTEPNEPNEPNGPAEPSGRDDADEANGRAGANEPDGAQGPDGTQNEPGGAGRAGASRGAEGPREARGAGESARPEAASAPVGWLPDGAEALFGEGARAAEAYGLLTVDVPAASWLAALEQARDGLGCGFFDWLSAVDEPGTGLRVCAHLVALPSAGGTGAGPRGQAGTGREAGVRRLLLRTTVPHEKPVLPSATGLFAGAAWHERETYEMFGVDFTGHPDLTTLLLPESFEGHPLRKDFVLAARVAKAWPGAVEPGESAHGAPKRRQMLPPGVPDPNEWGPLKGQLPPVPSRPARGRAGRAGAAERPARRTRSASGGSASQRREAGGAEGNAPSSDAPWRERGGASREGSREGPGGGTGAGGTRTGEGSRDSGNDTGGGNGDRRDGEGSGGGATEGGDT